MTSEPEERLERAREDGRRKLAEDAPRAAIYCRMSVAAIGDTTKVEDQERISQELCERRGWRVAGVYSDNNRSAWQKNRKRKQWDRMLEDVGAGKIDAIVVYHGDRLVRQPWDLEVLLKLADGKGIKLASPTGTRDLDNDDDQFILSIEAAAARRESASTSRRKKAQYERMRRVGLVRSGGRGGRAFGFATDGVTHVPAECELIREAAARVLEREPTLVIVRDFTARGVVTPTGRPFSHHTMRKMLARPRYAGLMPDGVSKSAWNPVLERAEWEAVCGLLEQKASGFGYATNARRYLLSGIARCGAPGCGATMRVRDGKGYECVQPGCRKAYRSVSLLDAYAAAAVVGRLAKAENPGGHLPVVPGLAAEWRKLADDRAEIEAMIVDPSKGARVHLLLARLDSLDARIAELRELARGDADARLRGIHAGITVEEFGAEPLGTRRALVSACYEVVVLPASRRGPGFRTEDVRLVPRGDGGQGAGQRREGDGDADPGGEGGDAADDPQVAGLAGLAARDAGPLA